MTKQMIENSDRGITLAKPLAWTILVTIIGATYYLGIMVGNLSTQQEQLITEFRQEEDQTSDRFTITNTRVAELAGRLRTIESLSERLSANIDNIEVAIQNIQTEQRETNRLLRSYLERRPIDGP